MILTKSSAPQASYAKTWLPLDGKPDKNHNKTDRILHDKCAARDAALDPRSSSDRVLTQTLGSSLVQCLLWNYRENENTKLPM